MLKYKTWFYLYHKIKNIFGPLSIVESPAIFVKVLKQIHYIQEIGLESGSVVQVSVQAHCL